MSTPGLKFLCRDSCSTADGPFDHPLSSRFDEQDAFVIFDDVEVPRDRVFIDARLDTYNAVMMTGWAPNIMQQTMIRAQTKLEFAWGLATWMVNAIGDGRDGRATRRALVVCRVRARLRPGRGGRGARVRQRRVVSRRRPAGGVAGRSPQWFPRVNEIIRLLGSHNLLAAPTASQLGDPTLRPLIDRYLRGANGVSAEDRIRVFRLAWDFVGSALASRNEQYERFYLASGARNYQMAHLTAPAERAAKLVDRFLQEMNP